MACLQTRSLSSSSFVLATHASSAAHAGIGTQPESFFQSDPRIPLCGNTRPSRIDPTHGSSSLIHRVDLPINRLPLTCRMPLVNIRVPTCRSFYRQRIHLHWHAADLLLGMLSKPRIVLQIHRSSLAHDTFFYLAILPTPSSRRHTPIPYGLLFSPGAMVVLFRG